MDASTTIAECRRWRHFGTVFLSKRYFPVVSAFRFYQLLVPQVGVAADCHLVILRRNGPWINMDRFLTRSVGGHNLLVAYV